MKIGYFVNQYPKVSHTFIRREIIALERQGVEVERYAIRGWEQPLVDPLDLKEMTLTRHLMKGGVGGLLGPFVKTFAGNPGRFLKAMGVMFKLSKGSNRSLAHHFVSFMQAALLAEWMARDKVSHVHAHFGTNSAEVVLYARLLGGPSYSFTVHGPDEWDRPEHLHLREKVAHASFVACISYYTKSQMSRWIDGRDVGKLVVVRCGLDAEQFALEPSPRAGSTRFVCVGRLCREKAQTTIVEALALLRERGLDAELVLIGDGDTRSDIEALVARHALKGHVHLMGWQSSATIEKELQASRALVLPSAAEGLPVVIMEAFASGVPAISTWIAGIPELLVDGDNGWLIKPGSVEAVADAMADCLAKDDAALHQMGLRGWKAVTLQHDVNREAGELMKHFAESA